MLISGYPQEFLKRFASIPDMLELDHLTVSGDVTFGKGVVLKVSLDGIILLVLFIEKFDLECMGGELQRWMKYLVFYNIRVVKKRL